jgi:hypothetical protein
MPSVARSIAAAVVLGLVGTAHGQVSPGQPQLFTVEGILAPDQATADKVGYDPVSIGFEGGRTTRWLGVVGARSLQGDSFQGHEMIDSLLPNKPTFLVSGPSEIVSKLGKAPDGSRIVVHGMLTPLTRNWVLDKVDVLPPPASK